MGKEYRLHISNFLTIEELDLDLKPGIQGFVGANGAGKTNVLTAVESILSGKHDVKLIKDGEKRSEIRLEEIEDGNVVSSVSRIQTLQTNRLESSGLSPSTTPKKWLTTLLDEIAINPVRLISEDPVKYLKQHLPIKVEPTEVVPVEGMDIQFDLEGNSFAECEKTAEDIGVERRAQYKIVRHSQEIADELRIGLPPQPEKPARLHDELHEAMIDVKARRLGVEEKTKQRNELIQEVKKYSDEIEKLKARKDDDKKRLVYLDQETLNAEQTMKNEIAKAQQKFAQMSADLAVKKSAVAQRIEVDEETVEKYWNTVKQKESIIDNTPVQSTESFDLELIRLQDEMRQVVEYDNIQQRYKHLREKEDQWNEHKQRYEMLDEAYKYYAYDLPKRLVDRANLPVKGLEFREQELWVQDRHIDRLSESERRLVAVNLAVALAESKGHIAVCLDGVEIFDAEHRQKLLEDIKGRGLRVIYTRHGNPEHSHETEVIRNG